MKSCLSISLLFIGVSITIAAPADDHGVNIKPAKDHIDFLIGKDLVARYHVGADVAKPYFWPLNGPGGVPLTRAWPMEKAQPGETTDHVHQKSAWFCHGDVIPEGIELKDKIKGVKGVDFWSEAPGHGVIACIDIGEAKTGKDHAWITTKNEWTTADKVKILDDPSNPYPACWHSRGYGLHAANPFGRTGSGFPAMADKTDLVKLAKGDHLKLRYGILLHAEDAKNGRVEEAFEKFVKLGKPSK